MIKLWRNSTVSGRPRALVRAGVVSLGVLVATVSTVGVAAGLWPSAPAPQASAAPLGALVSWSTGFQVQNLSNTTANVRVLYYDEQGNQVGDQRQPISPLSSFTFFGATMAAPETFYGSIVIESDQDVAAISNELTGNPTMLDSFAANPTPARTSYLALVMRNNGGYSTELFIQNAGTADATDVKAEFYRRGETAPVDTIMVPALKPGGSYRIDQVAQERLGGSFVGSVRLTASQPVAAVVNQSNGNVLLSYGGVDRGSPRIFAPLVQAQNSGWETGLQVQNVGGTAQNVTLTVRDGSGRVVRTEQATIGANSSQTWFPIFIGARLIGSATIEGSPDAQLVGIVNQVNFGSGQGTTYTTFASGTPRAFAPLLMTNNSGFSTGLQAQNVGTAPTNVTITVKDLGGNVVGQETATVAAGSSKTWFPIPGTTIPGDRFVGSATIDGGAGSQIVAIVNTITDPQSDGDTSSSYVTINTAGP
ncbi:MAG: hypothetical protein HY329_26240 [Chloroflexi bacterium]|nr:hypothetical protein [Chloroflexota bacterium]